MEKNIVENFGLGVTVSIDAASRDYTFPDSPWMSVWPWGTLQDSQEEFGGRGTEASYSDAPSSESAGLDFGHSPYATRSYHGALEHLSTCVFKDEETKKMYIKKYKLVELLKNKGFLTSI